MTIIALLFFYFATFIVLIACIFIAFLLMAGSTIWFTIFRKSNDDSQIVVINEGNTAGYLPDA